MVQLTRANPRLRGRAGFTMIEVLVAALVLGIGLVGIIGMQTTAAVANRRASDIRTAADLAETALERLKRDALDWRPGEVILGTDTWLGLAVDDGGIGQWLLPPTRGGAASTPVFNDLGLPSGDTTMVPSEYMAEKNSRYCVQYRVSWVIVNELARADVRVFFPSRQAGERLIGDGCSVFADSAALSPNDYDQFFEWVRVTGMLRPPERTGTTGPT